MWGIEETMEAEQERNDDTDDETRTNKARQMQNNGIILE